MAPVLCLPPTLRLVWGGGQVGGWVSRWVDDATFTNVLMLNLSSYRQPDGGYPAWPNTPRRLLLLSPQLGLGPVSSPRLPLLPPPAMRTTLGRPRDPFNLHLILDSTVRAFYTKQCTFLIDVSAASGQYNGGDC